MSKKEAKKESKKEMKKDNSSTELSGKGKNPWAKDLIKAASRLPFHSPELTLTCTTSIKDVQVYAKLVHKLMLEGEINSSDKLYLLHDCPEPQKDRGPAQITSWMWHYMTMVKTQCEDRAMCQNCKTTEDLEHILVRCESPRQEIIWKVAKALWLEKETSWLEVTLGSILGCGLAEFRDDRGKPKCGLYRILMSESV
ncbi:hypothetical protein DFH07DRAFT_769658 [Mycena maculata]|uniref:Reverse transcriptase zinc-binding domain-containing protein n=1 Tax=Mycena maculata TaxID=230809 RepID=A0AAD7JKT4_9AGAR|nr:hypothetical protein DFH07DRAFT_769658 [Mycena maculata]